MTKETFNPSYIKAKYDVKLLIVELIVNKIQELNLTRTAAAQKLGLKVSKIYDMFSGRLDNIGLDVFKKACTDLDIDLSDQKVIQELFAEIKAHQDELSKKQVDIFADIPGLSEEEKNVLTFKANLSSIIVHELTTRKLTRAQAAELMDVSVSVVGLYYRADVMRMNLETMLKSCMRLGIKPTYDFTPYKSMMLTVSIGKM